MVWKAYSLSSKNVFTMYPWIKLEHCLSHFPMGCWINQKSTLRINYGELRNASCSVLNKLNKKMLQFIGWDIHLKEKVKKQPLESTSDVPYISIYCLSLTGYWPGFLCLAIYSMLSWIQYRSNSNYGNRNLWRGQCDGLHLASLYKSLHIDFSNSQHLQTTSATQHPPLHTNRKILNIFSFLIYSERISN